MLERRPRTGWRSPPICVLRPPAASDRRRGRAPCGCPDRRDLPPPSGARLVQPRTRQPRGRIRALPWHPVLVPLCRVDLSTPSWDTLRDQVLRQIATLIPGRSLQPTPTDAGLSERSNKAETVQKNTATHESPSTDLWPAIRRPATVRSVLECTARPPIDPNGQVSSGRAGLLRAGPPACKASARTPRSQR